MLGLGFCSPTKHELTKRSKTSRRPNLLMRKRFKSADSLLRVDIRYFPVALACRAIAKVSELGREHENIKSLNTSRGMFGLMNLKVRFKYSSMSIFPRSKGA